MRAPTRIDFGGGWTDVPPYPEEVGGCVCNIAIDRYATVSVESLADADADPIAHVAHAGDERLLLAGARQAAARGIRLGARNDFPVGAGLGGSSAAGVALQGALSALHGCDDPPELLAERSRSVEVEELGIAGGRQDHYAAAFGGALELRFTDRVGVRRLHVPAPLRARLLANCLLLYTGESRISADTITAVLDRYAARDPRVLQALARMAGLASEMCNAIEDGDFEALAASVSEHWEWQRGLHPAITTPRIDAIFARATELGAIGGKALGASGGGCVMIFTPDEDVSAAVRGGISELSTELRWGIDESGVSLVSDPR